MARVGLKRRKIKEIKKKHRRSAILNSYCSLMKSKGSCDWLNVLLPCRMLIAFLLLVPFCVGDMKLFEWNCGVRRASPLPHQVNTKMTHHRQQSSIPAPITSLMTLSSINEIISHRKWTISCSNYLFTYAFLFGDSINWIADLQKTDQHLQEIINGSNELCRSFEPGGSTICRYDKPAQPDARSTARLFG